ncbi:helix-turn-helix domain-containing protein [Tenacibaculum finnmarkense genomovar ulcerans]|uniref:helix-turn-helix domain-containing protein n=1 Tax=Tenacibaculum finnmarkense TaxID=2781243 RepID=UPI00187B20CE|nr:helix-turn-helix transcriptional regulator [Tenacibaculum finnmarkense]MBE7633170.1 helix-turn-helix domain-containing protein [Tenacibaculum finnmarkense genomovar ulcerans]MCD8429084.1 helix-turn-helix domain-containing protein [Tenacibaculum finnmarkense genomovar ulcerans]
MTDKEKLQLTVGKRIKEIRESKNIAQQDLAAACNFEKSNMARLESGKTNPTLYTLQKIAKNLDVKLSFLIDID